jgi:hypothetical protein
MLGNLGDGPAAQALDTNRGDMAFFLSIYYFLPSRKLLARLLGLFNEASKAIL